MNLSSRRNYVAIIGDMVDSKKMDDRKDNQEKFVEILNNINKKYKGDIISKFNITLGDEFQGVLNNCDNIIQIIEEIEFSINPVEFRFGIGVGEISTNIDYENSFRTDGTAFHRARQMIKNVSDKNKQHAEFKTNIMIKTDELNKDSDALLNSLFSTSYALKKMWTKRQYEIISEYLQNDCNQYKCSKVLKINQASVSKALKVTNYYTYKNARNNISDFLANR